jgi:hypothetical protein
MKPTVGARLQASAPTFARGACANAAVAEPSMPTATIAAKTLTGVKFIMFSPCTGRLSGADDRRAKLLVGACGMSNIKYRAREFF